MSRFNRIGFSVGSIVSWAEAGVGAIATQSFCNPNFGPDGLALLKQGKTVDEVLDQMIGEDEDRDVRQVAIVDAKGNNAVYTGKKCIAEAGHLQGKGYSVQANMMLNATVWPAMSEAFENSSGPLEDRLIIALEAAEAAGGDIRGKQSAAILVVNAKPTGKKWVDEKVNISIDDHATPIEELKRILNIKKAYDFMNEGDVALEKDDTKLALELYKKSFEMYPENEEMKFWTAVTYTSNGQFEQALPMFKSVFEINSNWRELVKRIAGSDLLPLKEGEFDSDHGSVISIKV